MSMTTGMFSTTLSLKERLISLNCFCNMGNVLNGLLEVWFLSKNTTIICDIDALIIAISWIFAVLVRILQGRPSIKIWHFKCYNTIFANIFLQGGSIHQDWCGKYNSSSGCSSSRIFWDVNSLCWVCSTPLRRQPSEARDRVWRGRGGAGGFSCSFQTTSSVPWGGNLRDQCTVKKKLRPRGNSSVMMVFCFTPPWSEVWRNMWAYFLTLGELCFLLKGKIEFEYLAGLTQRDSAKTNHLWKRRLNMVDGKYGT